MINMNQLLCKLVVYEPNKDPKTINFLVDKNITKNNLYPVFKEDGTVENNFNLFIQSEDDEISRCLHEESLVEAAKKTSSNEFFRISENTRKLLEESKANKKNENRRNRIQMSRDKMRKKKLKAKIRKKKKKAVKRFFASAIDCTNSPNSYPNVQYEQNCTTSKKKQAKAKIEWNQNELAQRVMRENCLRNHMSNKFGIKTRQLQSKHLVKSNVHLNHIPFERQEKNVNSTDVNCSIQKFNGRMKLIKPFIKVQQENSKTEKSAVLLNQERSAYVKSTDTNEWNSNSNAPPPDFIPLIFDKQTAQSTFNFEKNTRLGYHKKRKTVVDEKEKFIGISQRAYFLNQG